MSHPGATDAAAGGFAVADGGARWIFSGPLTMNVSGGVLEAARELPLPASGDIDFAGLGHADSSALAVMIALKNRGAAEGRAVTFHGVPAALHALAVVYGIDALL